MEMMDFDQGLTEDDIFVAENGSQVDVKDYLRELRQQIEEYQTFGTVGEIVKQLGYQDLQIEQLRQQLQAAEQRAAEAEAHLRAVLDALKAFSGEVDWGKSFLTAETIRKMNEAPLAAAAWLEAGDK
jgi:chromosome segregation ATPase